MAASVDPPAVPAEPFAEEKLGARSLERRQSVGERDGLGVMGVCVGLFHERATPCEERQPSAVGIPLDPAFEVMEVAVDVVLPLSADGGLGRVRDAEQDPWVRFGAYGVDREQELVERFRWPSVAEVEQPQRSRDACSHEWRVARGFGFQSADPRPHLSFMAADRIDRGEIGQVPGRDPLLPEVECEAFAFFGRGEMRGRTGLAR